MGPSGLRLAICLLTIVPVARGTNQLAAAGRAMVWAPLVGLLLGLAGAAAMAASESAGHPPLLAAVLGVAALALLTRGLHLDGLADTADGLGTGRPAPDALAVMRTGDVGPFGVVTLVLTLVVQVAAAAQAGPLALLAAAAVGRVAMTVACRRGVPAARADGLGALVASSVRPLHAALLAIVALGAAATLGWVGPPAVAGGLLAGEVLLRRCVRRLGGITGDVLGAVCEIAMAATLVVLAADLAG